LYPKCQKVDCFTIHDNLLKSIHHQLPSNLLPHYTLRSTTQLYVHIRENNMLQVRHQLFYEFLFACLFFILTLTSLCHYYDILFVVLLILFIYDDERLAQH